MKLVATGTKARLGCLIGAEVILLGADGLGPDTPSSMAELLAGGEPALQALRDRIAETTADEESLPALRAHGCLLPLAEAQLRAPVQPRLIVCNGRAYRAHRKEMGIGDQPIGHPSGFIKNANAVTGPGTPVHIPPMAPDMVDFEGELAAVFHTECHGVTPDRAWAHIAGLTLVNDVSARNWVELSLRTGNRAPLVLGKQFPTFLPLGPCLATLDEFEDVNAVEMTTTVNGELMQSSTTADLIWPVAELIAHFSSVYLFRPGDVLTFGTPNGVGYGRSPQIFLADGDEVAIHSPAIGTLRNKMKAINRAAPPLGVVGNEEE